MTHPPVIRYHDRYTGRLENERVYAATFLNWAYNSRTGRWAVGSIRQTHQTGVRVSKGDRKGFFGLGGSTVVLLFKPGFITFDEDILSNTGTGMETYIRMGDSIGRQSGRCDAFYRIQGEKR